MDKLKINELCHSGVKGQKWYVRRYQYPDGSLTPLGRKHYGVAEKKWVKKFSKKITSYAEDSTKKEMYQYGKFLKGTVKKYNSNGKLSRKYIFEYNKMQAKLMTQKVSDVRTPTGKVIAFVAKRGELGTWMAIADQGYNLDQLKNGLTSEGRVSYKKDVIEQIKED